tara:strand:+ start:1298 stop:2125 length:828 start_codon:yes stop_codon:yes gene_type:complete
MSTKKNIADYFTPEQMEKRNRQTRNQPKRANSPDQGLIDSLGYQKDDTKALEQAIINMHTREADRVKLENEMMQSTKGGSSDDTAALNKAIRNMHTREADRVKLENEMMSAPLVSSIFNQTMYPNPVYAEEPDPLNYLGSPPAFDREPAHGGLPASNNSLSPFVHPSINTSLYQQGVPVDNSSMIPENLFHSIKDPSSYEMTADAVNNSLGYQPKIYPSNVYKNIVRDGDGNMIKGISLPTQNPNYKAPAGGKGANATPQSAIDQLTGIKGFGGK